MFSALFSLLVYFLFMAPVIVTVLISKWRGTILIIRFMNS